MYDDDVMMMMMMMMMMTFMLYHFVFVTRVSLQQIATGAATKYMLLPPLIVSKKMILPPITMVIVDRLVTFIRIIYLYCTIDITTPPVCLFISVL